MPSVNVGFSYVFGTGLDVMFATSARQRAVSQEQEQQAGAAKNKEQGQHAGAGKTGAGKTGAGKTGAGAPRRSRNRSTVFLLLPTAPAPVLAAPACCSCS